MITRAKSPHHISQLASFDDRASVISEIYHFLINKTWGTLFLYQAAGYLLVNFVFSVLYFLGGDCIGNAKTDHYPDYFFFSVQTLSTIGFGHFYPKTVYSNTLVAIEAFIGLLGVALSSGLAFAKFSKPTAKVVFSRFALITQHDGRKVLTFRLANGRASNIMDAHIQVAVMISEKTSDGTFWRKFHTVKLERNRSPAFYLTWTVFHVIDPESPFFGKSAEDLERGNAVLFLTFTGIESTLSQTIHSHYSYRPSEIIFNHRFADIIAQGPHGKVLINYSKFHEIEAEKGTV